MEADTQWSLPRWLLPAAVLGAFLLFGLMIGVNAMAPPRAEQSSAPQTFVPPSAGTPVDPPRSLSDIALTNAAGETVHLSDLQGQPVLLYFGYTFCPDICPTSLADMARARHALGAQADDVHFVFVSVDPERDTPAVLKRYVDNFDPAFIALSSERAVLRGVAPEYGLYFEKNEVAGTSASYLIDHSASIYLIDATGQLRMIYGYGIPAEVLTNDLQTVLAGQPLS